MNFIIFTLRRELIMKFVIHRGIPKRQPTPTKGARETRSDPKSARNCPTHWSSRCTYSRCRPSSTRSNARRVLATEQDLVRTKLAGRYYERISRELVQTVRFPLSFYLHLLLDVLIDVEELRSGIPISSKSERFQEGRISRSSSSWTRLLRESRERRCIT